MSEAVAAVPFEQRTSGIMLSAGQQVHRRDAVGVVMKERLPPLGRRSPSPRNILCNGGLPDIDAELEKLAMNPWCAPQWVGEIHLANETTDFQRGLWTATARS